MKKQKPKAAKVPPVNLSALLAVADPNSIEQQRQTGVNQLIFLKRAQEMLLRDLVGEKPTFNVGDPANGGVTLHNQLARDILGAAVEKIGAKLKDTEAMLVKLGVNLDDKAALDRAAGVEPKNRTARRAIKKVARKKSRR